MMTYSAWLVYVAQLYKPLHEDSKTFQVYDNYEDTMTMTMIFISNLHIICGVYLSPRTQLSNSIQIGGPVQLLKAVLPQTPKEQKLQKETCIRSFCEGKPMRGNGRDWRSQEWDVNYQEYTEKSNTAVRGRSIMTNKVAS